MVRKSCEIAKDATRLVAGEGLKLFYEREVVHVLNNSEAMIKRVALHKSGNIGEILKILNNVMNVRMGLSAYIW